MKITDITCYVVEGPNNTGKYRWRAGLPASGDGTPGNEPEHRAILRIDTDGGVTGAIEIDRGNLVADVTRRRLKRLVGQDPMMSEKMWHLIWEIDRVEEFHMAHLGLVDQICWDIKSRVAGLPVHQLLGGYETAVPAYASTVTWDTMEEYERYIKDCMNVGFKAFKLHAWGDARADAELSRNLRKWTGPEAELMFDGSAGWDFVTSLEFGRVLEGENFLWYEEPMREFELTSYVKLTEQLNIPMLACETSDGCHWNAATWIDMGALDMMRTSCNYKGGLTGALKVAHLAEAHGMRAQVHGMGHANAQLCAAIPNNDYYEQLVFDGDHIAQLDKMGSLSIIDGMLHVSTTPGLGDEEYDWAEVEKRAVRIV